MILLLFLAGCAGPEPPANLLLVTLDTTRADRLGCYGHAAATTPTLDRLAAEGFTADRAVAVAPLTLPSHASMFTGLYPPRHGVRTNTDFRLPGEATTLAERLRDAGYATAAVVGAYVLSADFGLDQGFGRYDEPAQAGSGGAAGEGGIEFRPMLERAAPAVTDAALRLLADGLEEPFFLWVHYFDPHAEYAPGPPFAESYADAPYDGEIAFTDLHLGRLVDTLRHDGRLDRTLVAVTADHGESLGQHGEDTHGLFVYEATLRVPLILRLPGALPAGLRSDRLVSGVDLTPTVLELLGLPPATGIDGTSFAPAARGESMTAAREPAYAEAELPLRAYGWSPLHALHDGSRKYIEAPRAELYDLLADPGELSNLLADGTSRGSVLAGELARMQATWPAAVEDAERRLDAEQRARLSSLGYASAAGAVPERSERPDPKLGVSIHNALLVAQGFLAREDLRSANTLVQKVLAEDPWNPAALGLAGSLAAQAQDVDGGIALLEQAAARSPGVFEIQRNLAAVLHRAGKTERAEAAYRRALELQPFAEELSLGLGNLLHDAGRLAEAAEAYRTAVEHDPGLADGWHRLGIVVEKQGQPEEARKLYRRALDANPEHAGALFDDAKLALRAGDADRATRSVDALLRVDPGSPTARYLEAQVRLLAGDENAARAALERFLAQDNADPRLVPDARDQLRRLRP